MKTDKLLLLQDELEHLDQAASHLAFSQKRTQAIIQQESWTYEELERLESLSSRFARLSDLLTQKIMRRNYQRIPPECHESTLGLDG
jgi:hypothetical protein